MIMIIIIIVIIIMISHKIAKYNSYYSTLISLNI